LPCFSGTGVGGNGALINSSNTPASYSGIINGTVNSQSFTVGGSGDINLIGSINGNTLLTKIGNSSLTISGTNDNFGLSANVSSGSLVLAKTSSHTPDVHAIGGNAPLNSPATSGPATAPRFCKLAAMRFSTAPRARSLKSAARRQVHN